jgi:hypothetical protein
VPAEVRAGDRVDVYVRTAGGAACQAPATCDGSPVVARVVVLDAPTSTDELGSDGSRMLVLGMSGVEAATYFSALEGADEPALTVVGRS